MTAILSLRYADGSTKPLDPSDDDFAAACRQAIELADELGLAMQDAPKPQSVDVHIDGVRRLTLHVIEGGLNPSSPGA